MLHRGNGGNCLRYPWSLPWCPLKCSNRKFQIPHRGCHLPRKIALPLQVWSIRLAIAWSLSLYAYKLQQWNTYVDKLTGGVSQVCGLFLSNLLLSNVHRFLLLCVLYFVCFSVFVIFPLRKSPNTWSTTTTNVVLLTWALSYFTSKF